MRNQQVGNSEIITSVRYGKGALKQRIQGTAPHGLQEWP